MPQRNCSRGDRPCQFQCCHRGGHSDICSMSRSCLCHVQCSDDQFPRFSCACHNWLGRSNNHCPHGVKKSFEESVFFLNWKKDHARMIFQTSLAPNATQSSLITVDVCWWVGCNWKTLICYASWEQCVVVSAKLDFDVDVFHHVCVLHWNLLLVSSFLNDPMTGKFGYRVNQHLGPWAISASHWSEIALSLQVSSVCMSASVSLKEHATLRSHHSGSVLQKKKVTVATQWMKSKPELWCDWVS